MKKTIPVYYRAPLTRRNDIEAFLMSEQSWTSHGGADYANIVWHFCFDVKVQKMDTSFTNLLQIYGDAIAGDSPNIHDAEWIAGCQSLYSDPIVSNTFEWASEICRNRYVNHDGKPDDDSIVTLADGQTVDPEFRFFGRSGGWLTLVSFDGWYLPKDGYGELTLENMPFNLLKRLYRYIVKLSHDLAPAQVQQEIKYQMAFEFFENFCRNVRSPLAEDREKAQLLQRQMAAMKEYAMPLRRRIDRNIRRRELRSVTVVEPRRLIIRPRTKENLCVTRTMSKTSNCCTN